MKHQKPHKTSKRAFSKDNNQLHFSQNAQKNPETDCDDSENPTENGTKTKSEKEFSNVHEHLRNLQNENPFIKNRSSPFDCTFFARFSGPYILLACSSKINKLHHFWSIRSSNEFLDGLEMQILLFFLRVLEIKNDGETKH
jgi:hypothetical protein